MTIEQRVLAAYGTTDDPYLAVWLLRDGTLLNGSHEGRQRDRDHREINEFFRRSKLDSYACPGLYVDKFMRRGNVRWHMSEDGMCIELVGPPSVEQAHVICRWMSYCARNGIDVLVDHRPLPWGRPRKEDRSAFLDYLGRYGSYR